MPASPPPGTKTAPCNHPEDACLCCGIKGSAAYFTCTGQVATGFIPNCANTSYQQSQKNTGGNIVSDVSQQVQNAILGPIEQWLPGAAEKIGLFLFALILVVVGVVILR